MKNKLLFLLFINNVICSAQFQINVINVTTNDLVYDSKTDRIYASIPSSNAPNGNSIGIIDPTTSTLENTIFIGSEPTVLAISDNGTYIYTGFIGTSTIRRFHTVTQTAGLQFSIGNDTFSGPYYAEDIEVMPGNPNTIAVSRRNNGFSPRHEGVVIFDDDLMRPTTTSSHTGSNKIEFIDNTSLFGYNNETTEFGLRRLSVNESGVNEISVVSNVLSSFNVDFIYNNNYVYTTNGKVIDVSSTPFVIGQFSGANGPVIYDDYSGTVCFATSDFSGSIAFKRFNTNTFLVQDNFPISQVSGTPKSIITCGDGCYAFNTSDNKVVILKDIVLGVDDIRNENKLTISPNPTKDYISINSKTPIQDLFIIDMNGRMIENIDILNNKVDLTKLESGIYLLKLRDIKNREVIKKIIKE